MSVANNLIGKTLSNRYEILRPLGEGGMGKVYLAKDKRFGKQVVVKVPTMEAGDKEFKDRFMREIASLATLEHPHIVTTVDWGEIEGIPFLVLRYLGGGSLRDRITDAQGLYKPMPLEGLNQWLPQIASALDFIHTKNWVHRDLKPDNILFDEASNPYLADFGIAKALKGAPMGVKTTMGAFIGTPQYMAPEMHLGKGIGPRADQFGLGVLVYEALAGKIPFAGATPTAIFVEMMHGKARPIHELVLGIPLEKSNALMKGITKEPKNRYGSCVEFANAVTGSMLARGSSSSDSAPLRVVIPGTRLETSKKPNIPGTLIETPSKPEIAGTILEKSGSRPDIRLRSEDYLTKSGIGLEQLCKDFIETGKVTKELFLAARQFCKSNDVSEIPGGVLIAEKIETILKKGHVSKEISEQVVSLAKEILGIGKPLITDTRVGGTSKPEQVKKWVPKGLQKEMLENFEKRIKLEMVLIPAGKFMMGTPASVMPRCNDEMQYEVTLTKPFYMGKYEVTQEQWEAVMGNNPCPFKESKFPVTNVSWNDCQEFIKKLNTKTDGGYRLPTEAEWEYACRAGTDYRYGDNLTRSDANIDGSNIKAVGSYKANAFGLYDMYGNVWEWCEDWFDKYPAGSIMDPVGPANGEYRVLRGGSFLNYVSDARSSFRYNINPNFRYFDRGFRLARTADVKAVVAAPIVPNSDPAVLMPATANIFATSFTEAEAKKVAKVKSEKEFVHKRKKEKEGNKVGGINDEIIPSYVYVIFVVTMLIIDLNLEKPMFFKLLKSYGIALGEKKTSTFQGTFSSQSDINKNSIKKNDIARTIVAAAFIAAIEKDMILIPAGNFKQGSPASEKGRSIDEIQHEVTITKPFYMGKYEVMQEQWEAVMKDNPSSTKGDKLPVTNVSWIDCQEFIKKLNAKTSGDFRLPTEAEWEYACRAGTTTAYSFGDMITSEDSNYSESKIGKPVEVGSYKANTFGLYDMHGNAWEWCEDWKTEYLVKDALGTVRVLRGGSFNYYGSFARSSSRYAITPTYRGSDFGFRLARTP
jgi:formylglycine-generating enzyme required for sulfatase activity/serine/threonine protein kinase